jgi:hypothetical protein
MSTTPIRKNVDLDLPSFEVTIISANSSKTQAKLEQMDQFCPSTISNLRSQIWRET